MLNIYSSLGHPYYIYALDYRETSSGIMALHYLCHALNLQGKDAYVAGCTITNRDLKTPVLTDEIRERHLARNKLPIYVYPEIVQGNPWNADVVVRYHLNREGLLNGTPINAGPNDLHFHFAERFRAPGQSSEGNLTVPSVDRNVFRPPDVARIRRTTSYLYLNRQPEKAVDFSKLPVDIQVLTTKSPKTSMELAAAFQQANVLYSYEFSNTCTMAAMCGCPVVYIRGRPELDFLSIDPFWKRKKGWVWIDELDQLEHARETTASFMPYMIELEEEFWTQLSHFISVTQEKATNTVASRKFQKLFSYEHWLESRQPTQARTELANAIIAANLANYEIAVAIIDDYRNSEAIQGTLDSVFAQTHSAASITVLSEQDWDTRYEGVNWLQIDDSWPESVNTLLESSTANTLLVVHAGDVLLKHAILLLVEQQLRSPGALASYGDEDFLENGVPAKPMLKPDCNIDLLRSYPYIGRTLAFDVAAAREVGGLTASFGDVCLVDLVWRFIEQAGPQAIAHVPEVLVHGSRSLFDWIEEAGTSGLSKRVVEAHFERMGVRARVSEGQNPGFYTVAYQHSDQPLVSIIIPTKDQLPVLRACVESLIDKTEYKNYELVIIDNNSQEAGARKFLDQLESLATEQARILRWPNEFDFSRINNFAAQYARGDVLLFLNNDVEITEPEWLSALLNHALRPEVGIVGARLDYPDGRVQHGGLVLGMENSVGFAFQGIPAERQGYMSRLHVTQNVSAVTGACMMMRRDVFDEIGGFDEESFSIYYGDVDIAMRARQAGFLTVLASEARLIHMGGATRLLTEKFGVAASPDDADRDRLYAKWLPQLASDPAYHPAYGKKAPGFDLSSDAARIQAPLPGRPLPVVLASHSDWQGCGHYRIIQPYEALESSFRVEGGLKFGDFHFTDVARIEPDVIVLQGAWANEGILKQIERYQEGAGSKVVLEFDDYVPNIPVQSIYRKKVPQSVIAKIRRTMEKVDWLVVSTQALAEEYAQYHHDIRVANNGLFGPWWKSLVSERRAGKKPRVGWAGGSSHTGDLAVIRALVKGLENEVEWVFMGMQPKDVACEFHAGVPIEQYPQKLASLNLDLAIVPLEINQFNTCKSNLRLLELGVCGVPVICTDIEPYRCDLPVTRVRNRYQNWEEAVRSHLADLNATARAGDKLREAVLRDWMLEGSLLDEWVDAWLPRI